MDLEKYQKITNRLLAGVPEAVRDSLREQLRTYSGLPRALEEVLDRTGGKKIFMLQYNVCNCLLFNMVSLSQQKKVKEKRK